MKIKVYGCRGSLAYSRDSYFGGNTSCIVLENGKNVIILDAGSGIMKLESELRKKYKDYPNNMSFEPIVILSHLHLDHILGLVGFAPIWAENTNAKIYTCSRSDTKTLKEQVFDAFVPPYWPVHMEKHVQAKMVEINGTFEIGNLTITPFAATHPDKTLSFHITDGVTSIVHLLDNEITPNAKNESSYTELLFYSHNADLIVFDAAYLEKDYEQKIGYGHSTVQEGVILANQCNCKHMLFAHYSQEYTDKELEALKHIVPNDGRFIFATEGMEIDI